MKAKPIRCESLDEVMFVIGGLDRMAKLVDCSKSAVCNWRGTAKGKRKGRGKFPAEHYAVIAMALHERGFYAPWRLFRFSGIAADGGTRIAKERRAV